jgi:uncharacterized repeat protein (TIGR02543 family)
MRRSLYATASAIAAVFLVLFVGCDLMTGPDSGQSAARDGKAAVSLSITGTEARTVVPTLDPDLQDVKGWELWGAKNGEDEDRLLKFTDPNKGDPLYLETGEWAFTLVGYNDSSRLILEGTIPNQTISLEGSNKLEFTVAPVLDGEGTVKITINLPDGHGITQAKVFKDGVESGSITPQEKSVFYEDTLAAGNYYFSFRLYNEDGDLYGVVSELVKVRANLLSTTEYTLGPEDLNIIYSISYYVDGDQLSGESAQPEYYRSTDAPKLPALSRLGYTFNGWHPDDGLSEGPLTELPTPGNGGNRDFYAAWEIIEYDIIYELNGGSGKGDNPAKYTVKDLPLTLTAPTHEGRYTFLYWYEDGSPEIAVTTISTGSTGEKTFWAKWHENGASLTSTADIGAYLVNAAGGDSAENPIALPPVNINLADGTNGWAALLSAISGADKFVALNLFECTMSGTQFDPGTANTGEKYIVSLVLPEVAESIKGFSNFNALTSVTGDNVKTIGQAAFKNCKALKTVDLPKVTSIEYIAFEGCDALETVTSPATSIGQYVFSNCKALKTVDLPNAISIDARAFQGCEALTEISLPSATHIENRAFYGTKTTALTVTLGKAAPTLGNNIFEGVSSNKIVTVIVPKGTEGYGTLPVTFSGDENKTGGPHWGEGFRGKGWIGSGYRAGSVNTNITLTIKEVEEEP